MCMKYEATFFKQPCANIADGDSRGTQVFEHCFGMFFFFEFVATETAAYLENVTFPQCVFSSCFEFQPHDLRPLSDFI